MLVYLNGKFVKRKDAKISVFDHGLLYGDGVFEGIRSYDRLVFCLKEHVDRLYESAHTLMLTIPLTRQQMMRAITDTLKQNNLKDAYIRVVVTRGEGDLGLDPRKCIGNANVFIIADKITLYPKEFYKNGLEIITVPTVRNLPEAVNPRLKSLNYLNNILAKIEANNAGYNEAIMLDAQGFVAECTGDNIFIIKGERLSTPSQGRLKGITLDAVLALAGKDRLSCQECFLTRHDIYVADECFLTGTAAEIVPVVKVDGRLIGSGKPGPRTLKLMKQFRQLTKEKGSRY